MNLSFFVTGLSGLLGLNTALMLRDRFTVSGCYHDHPVAIEGVQAWGVDLRQPTQLRAILEELRPAVILHTAGMVNVDECERLPAEAEILNVGVSRTVATLASLYGSKLVHLSTDHLFDGTRGWVTEQEPLCPVNVYGRTKALAESVVRERCPDALIIRTNFYGWGSPLKASLSDWILSGLERKSRLRMFTDVAFTPILIHELVEVLVQLVSRRAEGIYHVVGRERISKYEFALAIAKIFGLSSACVEAATLAQHPLYARRPYDMSLSCAKASRELGRSMPGIVEGLQRLKRLGAQGWRAQLAQAVGASCPQPAVSNP